MSQADKTKQKFADTLKELSRTKPMAKISVGDLVHACDVNRSTFYYHFLDMEDLVLWIFHNDITEHYFKIVPVGWKSNVLFFFEQLRKDCDFYQQAILLSGENSLSKELYRVFYRYYMDYLNMYLADKPISESGMDYIAGFYASATANTGIEYIKSGAAEEPEEMTDRFFSVLWPGLALAADNLAAQEREGHTSESGK